MDKDYSQHPFANLNKSQLKDILQINGAVFQERVSDLFLSQLHHGIITDEVHSNKVIDEIKLLEAGKTSRTKAAEQFRGEILKGFWKKHYMQSSHIVQNIMSDYKMNNPRSKKFENLYNFLRKTEKDPFKRSSRLADIFVRKTFEERADRGELTGEWIVFSKYKGLNYYLSIAFHTEQDEAIRDRIYKNCTPQFPFLFEDLES